MEVDQIIQQLELQQRLLILSKQQTESGKVEINNPGVLSEVIVKMRMLIVQLVDKVAEAELDYRKSKSARFDRFIKEGIKRSPAFDLLELEPDLIEKKIATERLKNYMKYCDSLVSSVQSLLKVMSSADKNQY